eukprot:4067527-Alexandrium_andersonii.AAC.1
MLLRPAITERAPVYAACNAKSVPAAGGGGSDPRGKPAPADGGLGGFPDGPIRRLVPATAAWVQEGTD